MPGELISADHANRLDAAANAELQNAMAVLARGGGPAMRAIGGLSSFAGNALGRGAKALAALPNANAAFQNIAEFALRRAFDVAVLRLHRPGEPDRTRRLTRPLVVMSGAVGGFLGLAGFLPDATVTSLSIMREIARIAQDEGEDLTSEETRASCLQVFALTLDPVATRSPELNYFSARLVMQGSPLAVLFTEVASRYGLSLSQKFALQAVPVLGAIGGASLNAVFLQHYRNLAKAHFTVRRLERTFGPAAVQAAYTH